MLTMMQEKLRTSPLEKSIDSSFKSFKTRVLHPKRFPLLQSAVGFVLSAAIIAVFLYSSGSTQVKRVNNPMNTGSIPPIENMSLAKSTTKEPFLTEIKDFKTTSPQEPYSLSFIRNDSILLANEDGKEQIIATPQKPIIDMYIGKWSPDGRYLYFVVNWQDYTSGSYIFDTVANKTYVLPKSRGTLVAWSPDSKKVALITDNSEATGDFVLLNLVTNKATVTNIRETEERLGGHMYWTDDNIIYTKKWESVYANVTPFLDEEKRDNKRFDIIAFRPEAPTQYNSVLHKTLGEGAIGWFFILEDKTLLYENYNDNIFRFDIETKNITKIGHLASEQIISLTYDGTKIINQDTSYQGIGLGGENVNLSVFDIKSGLNTEIDAYHYNGWYSEHKILVDEGYIFNLETNKKRKLPISGWGFVAKGSKN